MMDASYLTTLLKEAERAHAASGHSAADWAEWYAQYMLPILSERISEAAELQDKSTWWAR